MLPCYQSLEVPNINLSNMQRRILMGTEGAMAPPNFWENSNKIIFIHNLCVNKRLYKNNAEHWEWTAKQPSRKCFGILDPSASMSACLTSPTNFFTYQISTIWFIYTLFFYFTLSIISLIIFFIFSFLCVYLLSISFTF